MRRIGMLLGTLVLLFGAACGSDDSGSAASTTGAPATTAAPASTAAPDTTSTSVPPAVQEKLYYAKDGRIFVTEPGSESTAITDGPRDDQPAPSPDGTRIAYIRLVQAGDFGGELWVANADGSDAELLVPVGTSDDPASSGDEPAAAFRPTWSPDSSTIAYMTTIGLDGGDLQTVDPETGIVSSPEPPLWVSSYAWTNDSASIVFVSGTNDVSPVDVAVLDLETLDTSALVDATAAYNGVSVAPATSDKAIFVNANLPLPPEGGGGFSLSKPGIYSVDLSGGEPVAIAPDPDPDDYRWAAGDSDGCLWYARQFNEGTGELLLHRLCAGDAEPASPVTNMTIFPAPPVVALSTSIAYLEDGDDQSLFVLTAPDAAPIHIDDDVTAFAWVQ